MNNEPVAWMHQNPDYPISKNWSQEYNIPLYTHPAKTPTLVLDGNRVYPTAKTLTDEEIDEVLYSVDWAYDPVAFARAILRKAQEK